MQFERQFVTFLLPRKRVVSSSLVPLEGRKDNKRNKHRHTYTQREKVCHFVKDVDCFRPLPGWGTKGPRCQPRFHELSPIRCCSFVSGYSSPSTLFFFLSIESIEPAERHNRDAQPLVCDRRIIIDKRLERVSRVRFLLKASH